MWTAIWTVLGFVLVLVLLLFLGEPILAFAAEQLRDRRSHRLQLEQERTMQALLAYDRDALIWRQLDDAADTNDDQATEPPSAAEPAHPASGGATATT
jgi:hypothetical protein